jgi:hypothetical protein
MVLFKRSRSGGRFYATRGRTRLVQHECPKLRKPSKLRIAASEWRSRGWLELGVVITEMTELGQVITATTLAADGTFKLRMLEGTSLRPGEPPMYRNAPDLLGHVEMRYLDESGELSGSELWAVKIE